MVLLDSPKQYVLTKKIARQGSKAIILIPAILREELPPSTIVRVTIDVIKRADEVSHDD